MTLYATCNLKASIIVLDDHDEPYGSRVPKILSLN